MLFYPAALPLSRQTLTYTAGIIRRHRKQIGSPWRKLAPGQQALLVLAYLRKGETFAELAAGFGIGTATAWRYVTETVGLLAAPLAEAAHGAARCQAGRACLCGDRRHVDSPSTGSPPAGRSTLASTAATAWTCRSSPPRTGHRVGVPAAARRRPRPDRRPHLAYSAPPGRLRAGRAGRQGVPRRRGPHPHPLPGQQQASLPEGRQPAHAKLRSPGERANAQLKSGVSCANSAAAPGGPGSWPRPSVSCKPARREDNDAPVRPSPGRRPRDACQPC